MYSVVMMMALSGAAEAPECGRLFHRSCSGCYGCSGYCSGCSGYVGCSGYIGCSGCSGYVGCSGCSGWGCHGGLFSRHRSYGCCGGYSCSGCSGCYGSYGYYNTPMIIEPAAPVNPSNPEKLPPPMTMIRVPATIQVNVPADAVVYFDSFKSNVSGMRRYTTPNLESGKTYYYTVKVEINQDGRTVATTQRVVVRAGDQAQLNIDMTPAGSLTAHQE